MTSPHPAQRVPGQHAGFFSLRPLTEAQSLLRGYMDYAKQKQLAADGSPIFRIDAGFPAVAIADHAAASFYFGAPTTVLRREDKRRLGPGKATPALVGSAHPTVLSTGARHRAARAFTDAILALREDALLPALERVLAEHIDRWSRLDAFDLFEELKRFYSTLAFEWLFDCRAEADDTSLWADNAFTIGLDAAAAKAMAAAVVPRCPRAAIAATGRICSVIEASPLFPRYVALAEEHGVPREDLAQFLNFLAMVNAAGAPLLTSYPSVPRYAVDTPLRESLVEALAGTETAGDLLANEWLDCVFHEMMRHYAQPRVFYKEAVVDFALPTSSGVSYQIRAGERVMVFITLANGDPAVFSDPEAFDPSRFARDPSLKEKVILYGTVSGSENPYGCAAAATGQAELIWKYVNATLVRDCVWELVQSPDISVNHYNLVAPTDLQVTGFRRRADTVAEVDDGGLARDFRVATRAVWGLDVSFPRDEYFRIYGLYKQSLLGDVQGTAPSKLQAKLRLKWDAWSSVSGLTRDEAKREYTERVRALKPSLFAPDPDTTTTDTASVGPMLLEHLDASTQPAEGQDTLRLTISTGAPPRIGLKVSLVLRGERGEVTTPWFVVPGSASTPIRGGVLPWSARAEARASASVDVPHAPIGRPWVVEVRTAPLDGAQPDDHWILDEIFVTDPIAEASWTFPCWEAIPARCARRILFDGGGHLPQDNAAQLAAHRLEELAQRRTIYRWAHADDRQIPGFSRFDGHDSFPVEERFFEKQNLGELSTLFSAELSGAPESVTSLEEYGELLERWGGLPWVGQEGRWRSDDELGRNFLQGSHCTFIRRATALPAAFNGDRGVSVGERTLGALLDAGELFVADYALLDGLQPQDGVILRAPIALLWSDRATGALRPVAIQIDRDPDAPVFTPDDSDTDWLLAKLWVRMADTSLQQIGSHFLLTHALLEATSVATRRQLSSAHPVFKLLVPHMQNTIGITTLARKYLLSEGGLVDRYMGAGGGSQFELMERVYQNTSIWRAMHFPTDLADRGVDDAEALPNYPYRDDGWLFWEALDRYTAAILAPYYPDDASVCADTELQAWIGELRDEGFPDSDLPRALDTRAALQRMLVSLLFTAVVTHATMNYHQYETYSFVPNSPALMERPPPRVRGAATEQTVLETLPSKQAARGIISTVVALSRRWDEDIPLGQDPRRLFTAPAARLARADLLRTLRQIEETVDARNAERPVPFEVLKPSRMTHGLCL